MCVGDFPTERGPYKERLPPSQPCRPRLGSVFCFATKAFQAVSVWIATQILCNCRLVSSNYGNIAGDNEKDIFYSLWSYSAPSHL